MLIITMQIIYTIHTQYIYTQYIYIYIIPGIHITNSIKYNVSRYQSTLYIRMTFPVAEQCNDFWSADLSCLIL